MRKLNQKKIRWIVREMDKGKRSAYGIAKIQQVSPRWVREIYNTYKSTGEYHYPRKPGRKPSPISSEDKQLILETREKHPLTGAVALEKIMDAQGVHIPHNRIHRFLKEEGLAKDEPKKQRPS